MALKVFYREPLIRNWQEISSPKRWLSPGSDTSCTRHDLSPPVRVGDGHFILALSWSTSENIEPAAEINQEQGPNFRYKITRFLGKIAANVQGTKCARELSEFF